MLLGRDLLEQMGRVRESSGLWGGGRGAVGREGSGEEWERRGRLESGPGQSEQDSKGLTGTAVAAELSVRRGSGTAIGWGTETSGD